MILERTISEFFFFFFQCGSETWPSSFPSSSLLSGTHKPSISNISDVITFQTSPHQRLFLLQRLSVLGVLFFKKNKLKKRVNMFVNSLKKTILLVHVTGKLVDRLTVRFHRCLVWSIFKKVGLEASSGF